MSGSDLAKLSNQPSRYRSLFSFLKKFRNDFFRKITERNQAGE